MMTAVGAVTQNPTITSVFSFALSVYARSRPVVVVVVEGRYLVERSVDRLTVRVYVRFEINSLDRYFCN